MSRLLLFVLGLACLGIATGTAAFAQEEAGTRDARQRAVAELIEKATTRSFDVVLPGGTLSEQILTSQSIPDRVPPFDAEPFLTHHGCRQHSCDEKSIIVHGPDGTLRGAGLIHFNCQRSGRCSRQPMLAVFGDAQSIHAAEPVVRAWAEGIEPGMTVTLRDWSANPF